MWETDEYSEEDEVLGVFPPDAFAADQGNVDGEEEDAENIIIIIMHFVVNTSLK